MKKVWLAIVALLLVAGAGYVYYRFYFVFGEGVKSGELNFVVKKGYIFKTYEGRLIQAGIRSKTSGTIESYEFNFSIENKELAERLMLEGGKSVDLYYKEYKGALPWRGYTKYIVDSIITHPAPAQPKASALDDSSSVIQEQVQLAE